MKIEKGRYIVEVDLSSDQDLVAFTVGIRLREPNFDGAYPQRRLSLERHKDIGHGGVHVQVEYHLVSNTMNVGKLYIILNAKNDEELLETAKGFIYTLYEILMSMDQELIQIAEDIFHIKLVQQLSQSKGILVSKMVESLSKRMIEIRSSDKDRIIIESGKDLIPLLGLHELVPLIEPIINEENNYRDKVLRR